VFGAFVLLSGLALSSTVEAQQRCLRFVGYEWGVKQTADPALANVESDSMYVSAVYEPLIDIDNNFQLHPDLAESWESNADATTWIFHLRKDVKFQDGKPFVAADVVYSIRRLIDPAVGSPAASELAFLKPENIVAVDEHTVKISSDKPIAELPLALTTRFLLIVTEGATTASLNAKPNGTGPFKIEKFVPEAPRAVLTRYDNYWRGKPKSECIEISAIADPVSRLAAITSGQADFLMLVDPSTYSTLKSDPNLAVIEAKGSVFMIMAMRTDTPPFDNVKVREALKLVIDRNAMVQSVLLGYGAPGNDNPIPPSSPDSFRPDVPKRDVEKARMLLKEAGYHDDLKVDLYTGATPLYAGMLEMVQAYQAMAAEAGITVNIVTSPSDSFWDEIWLKKPFVTSYWSPRAPMSAFSIAYRSDSKYNETGWKRPGFDALLDKAEATMDPDARRKIYQEAGKVLTEEGGAIIPYFTSIVAAVRKGCTGYRAHVDPHRVYYADLECK
jgi:peptide/nickel transport system substrate-binding protein